MMPFFDDDEFFGDLLLMGAAGGGKAVEATATGNPLTFVTDLAKPLRSLLIPFTPVQSGTGDPSPENIRSIIPWDGLTVKQGGKSVIQFVTTELRITTNTYNGYSGWCNQLTIEPAFIGKKVTYSVEIDATNSQDQTNAVAVWAYKKGGGWQYIGEKGNNIAMGTKGLSTVTVTLWSSIDWIAFGLNVQKDAICRNPMVELGQTASAYEEYQPITETDIPFVSPVYGGTLDVVSGVLTVEYVCETTNGRTWQFVGQGAYQSGHSKGKPVDSTDIAKQTVCTHWKNTDMETMNNVRINQNSFLWLGANVINAFGLQFGQITSQDIEDYFSQQAQNGTPLYVCAPLYEPQEITLTPEQITALVGDNTIWSDADGSMTAVYLKKG